MHTPHYPYLLPKGWEWCKLEDIAYVASGSTPAKTCFVEKAGIPYIKMYNLRNQQIDFDYHPQYITEDTHNGKLQRSRTEVGDLIMNIVGPPLGKLALIPPTLPQANFNQAAVLIRPYMYKDILALYLKSYLEEMSEIDSVTTRGSVGQVNISLTQSQNMRIPLPPLAEQHRIVVEIERWFSLISIIESGKNDLRDTIKQAKNKILNLAIHGKLVPQDPNEEPASKLLKRINPKTEITSDNGHKWKLPQSWCWAKGRQIFLPMKSTKPHNDEFLYIDIDSIDNKRQIINKIKSIKTANAPSRASRYTQKGDVVFSMVRPYLRNIAKVSVDGCIASTGFYVCSPIDDLNSEYCYYLMISDYVVTGLNQFMKGDNSPSINKSHIDEWLFPLPPFPEQQRIVQKIEKLFSLLDHIKKSLEV
ncbi:restriction endonuclease subunit S [Bacteroides fragilis]|nr:restriction endonuclease subunit S [Bacteroides fragilis]